MCGGMKREDERPVQAPQNFTYTPPKMGDVYAQYRATGQIPYSYYGVGAPTREGELELLRKSYPGAFADAPTPTPSAPKDPKYAKMDGLGGVFQNLLQAISKSLREKHPDAGFRPVNKYGF